MNGVNGHSSAALQWKVGLVNFANKYLTAETFGFKVNVTGAALKKKQIWTLEQDLNEEVVYIKSHLGKYLSSDKYGMVHPRPRLCDKNNPLPKKVPRSSIHKAA